MLLILMEMKKRLVLKIGTSTLTEGTDAISHSKIRNIAEQILLLKDTYDIVLVTSGAIAHARQYFKERNSKEEIPLKQAMAAVGQPRLMKVYDEIFEFYGLKVAQCLVTYTDFKNDVARTNTFNTITQLIQYDYIPIVNENDTVAFDEIILGDNDKVSALVASVIDADLLIIASDIEGIYDKNPHLHKDAKLIEEVTDLDQVKSYVQEKPSKLGTGGMTTKIQAAEICKEKGIEMWIINGLKRQFLMEAHEGNTLFTKFRCQRG